MVAPPLVLLVEDNAELRHVLRDALAGEGYQVLALRDDAEALEVLRERPADLLISDVAGPGADVPTLDEVRREFPDLPVVALGGSGAGHPQLFFEAWQSPSGFRTLPKPFRLGELLAVSRQVLGTFG
ncbi:MAG TPA: response regulator [Longimicrobiales bacterium]|nr:response regulator [Longimicrobiales bacterium]